MSKVSKTSSRPSGATSDPHPSSGKSLGIMLGAILVVGIAFISFFFWIIMGGSF